MALVIPNIIGGAASATPLNDNFAAIAAYINGGSAITLAAGSVTTDALANNAVNSVKLLNGAVTPEKLVAGFIKAPTAATITLLNSWVNYGSTFAGFTVVKDITGRVFLGGTIKSGTSGLSVCTLPVGYRPGATVVCAIDSANQYGRVVIDSLGNVIPYVPSNASVSFDGVSFRTV